MARKSSASSVVGIVFIGALAFFIWQRSSNGADSSPAGQEPSRTPSSSVPRRPAIEPDTTRGALDNSTFDAASVVHPATSPAPLNGALKTGPSPASSQTEQSASSVAPVAAPEGTVKPEPPASPDLEAELGRERAAYYRQQEELAFHVPDEEEETREKRDISSQLAMTTNQETATTVVYEESQTALAQQQMTVRRMAAGMKTEERLAAYEKLAAFRKQFIFDRLKSILSPEQIQFFQDWQAEEQFRQQQTSAK